MLQIIGGLSFGIIVGFLSWRSVLPDIEERRITLKSVSAFIGVVGGATVLTLFPAGSEMFSGYSIGLLVGFFAELFIQTAVNASKEHLNTEQQQEEIARIENNWDEIERIVRHKMWRRRKYGGVLYLRELQEFPYSEYGKRLILQRYAQLHSFEGIEVRIENSQMCLVDTGILFLPSSQEINVMPPLSQFFSIYVIGDDLFDESFSIDSASGEFLGECGIAIKETIGIGEPKKVSAFEVWLFDKKDVQIMTKIVLSPYAYKDSEIRQAFTEVGELWVPKEGEYLELETTTIKMLVKVAELRYGTNSEVPPDSFFERFGIQIFVWAKKG